MAQNPRVPMRFANSIESRFVYRVMSVNLAVDPMASIFLISIRFYCALFSLYCTALELTRCFNKLLSLERLIHWKRTTITMGNPCYSLVWIILLVFLVWPVSMFVTAFWVILQPFEALFQFFADANACLESFVTWPRRMGTAIVNGDSSCPQP